MTLKQPVLRELKNIKSLLDRLDNLHMQPPFLFSLLIPSFSVENEAKCVEGGRAIFTSGADTLDPDTSFMRGLIWRRPDDSLARLMEVIQHVVQAACVRLKPSSTTADQIKC